MVNVSTRRIITENLYNGEKALRGFNAEFPYIRSNIKYNSIIERHKNNETYSKIIPKLRGKSVISGLMISQMRGMYENAPDKIKFLSKAVKATKTAGCRECSFLIRDRLEKMGIESQNIRFYVEQKNGFDTNKNHAFTVIGLDKGADLNNPDTWGKNAVIVDGWANMVKRAKEGIEYFKTLFKYNPEKEVYKFEEHRNI